MDNSDTTIPIRVDITNMSRVNEAADLNETTTSEPIRPGGIKEFIAQTTMIGNVIAAAASLKNSSEPLPFTDYSLFEENYGQFIKFKLFKRIFRNYFYKL